MCEDVNLIERKLVSKQGPMLQSCIHCNESTADTIKKNGNLLISLVNTGL
jgi:hypothetical protein